MHQCYFTAVSSCTCKCINVTLQQLHLAHVNAIMLLYSSTCKSINANHFVPVQSANRNLDEMLGAGGSILDGLRDQGSLLKGAHKRVLDLAATLGMSNTIMRLVERRGQQDKYILVGGMVVLLVLLYLLLRYF